jgi:putative transcription factor
MSHQDWTPVVFNSKKTSKQTPQTKKDVPAGPSSVPNTKHSNQQHAARPDNASKIARMEEAGSIKRVDPAVSKKIVSARTSKKFSQKDLAMKINENIAVVQSYESGTAIPNQQILGKMERVLDVKLRGKL